jgi:glycine betaine/proline transport system permease protein
MGAHVLASSQWVNQHFPFFGDIGKTIAGWFSWLQVGKWFSALVDWATNHLDPLFSFINDVLQWCVDSLTSVFLFLPALIFALILALIAWGIRGVRFGIFAFLSLALIVQMGQWKDAMNTLSLVLVASVIAVVIGIPIGIASARSSTVSSIVKPILDFMQTLPAFVYLIPAVSFFSIGSVPGVVATVVFALPPGVRLTELGIRQVDKEMVEAGEAFGAPPMKILTRIQFPLALPTIMAGINQVIMLSLSLVVIAGMVGAGGLGGVVYQAISNLDLVAGFEGGVAVVILAIYLDRVTASLGTRSPVARAQKAAAKA